LFHVRKILFLIALWHRNKNRINAKGNIFITPGVCYCKRGSAFPLSAGELSR